MVKGIERGGNEAPELDLDQEWQRLARRFAQLFAKRLHLTPDEYIKTLPQFPEKPIYYDYDLLGLTAPLIVETRIPWDEQASLAGIPVRDYLRERLNIATIDFDSRFTTPERPYTTWAQKSSSTRFFDRGSVNVRRTLSLSSAERGGTFFDGLAYAIAKPNDIRNRTLDLIGSLVSEYGYDRIPCLDDYWGDGVELTAYADGHAVPGSAFVCGATIRTL